MSIKEKKKKRKKKRKVGVQWFPEKLVKQEFIFQLSFQSTNTDIIKDQGSTFDRIAAFG